MKLSKLALKRLFSDLLRKRITDGMMGTLIESLWRDPGTGGGDSHAPVTIAETSADQASIDENQVLTVNDTAIKIAFDFITSDELFFTYCCPVAMVFTSQESEFGDAIITPALNTNLAQYDRVTITALETGMIILNGHTLWK